MKTRITSHLRHHPSGSAADPFRVGISLLLAPRVGRCATNPGLNDGILSGFNGGCPPAPRNSNDANERQRRSYPTASWASSLLEAQAVLELRLGLRIAQSTGLRPFSAVRSRARSHSRSHFSIVSTRTRV